MISKHSIGFASSCGAIGEDSSIKAVQYSLDKGLDGLEIDLMFKLEVRFRKSGFYKFYRRRNVVILNDEERL